MKNLVLAVLLAFLVAPVMAGVTITCEEADPEGNPGVVEIRYQVDDEQDLVRAFALDISVSAGEVEINEPSLDPNYWVYPGQIVIIDGEVDDTNTPVASGNGALTGPSGLTIEMASLYVGEANSPDPNGLLCVVDVNVNCTVTVTGNATRGNVVMESTASVEVSAACEVTGFEEGCQCWGDVSGSTLGVPDGVVGIYDLSYIVGYLSPAYAPSYVAPISPGYECADVSGATLNVPDGQISIYDLSAIVGYLSPAYAPSYNGPCMPDR